MFAEGDFFGQDIFEELPLAFNILSKLAGGIGEFINSFYSRDDIISALTAVGIEPGWVEIQSEGHTVRFYFAECGEVISESSSEMFRNSINTTNWFEFGYQEGDIIETNIGNFVVNANGNISPPIPAGTPIMWGATFFFANVAEHLGWRQDEDGEWQRTRPPENWGKTAGWTRPDDWGRDADWISHPYQEI